MSKKKIITVISIAFLIVIAAAASVISYSIATRKNNDVAKIDTVNEINRSGATVSTGGYVTNIDLIIQNANAAEPKTFNIIELYPASASASSLGTYVSNGGFAKYVIEANRTYEEIDDPSNPGSKITVPVARDSANKPLSMPTDKITYEAIAVDHDLLPAKVYTEAVMGKDADGNDVVTTPAVTLQTKLDNADLIYVNSPAYDSYNGNNNLSDELYDYLHVYALGNNKPMILNFVTSSSSGSTSTGKTYGEFANAVKKNYVRYRTYPWPSEASASDFFTMAKYHFIPRSVNSLADGERMSGKILVISTSNAVTASGLSGKMSTYTNANVIKSAYFGNSDKKPADLDYKYLQVSAGSPLTDAALKYDGTNYYDMYIIEKDVKNLVINSSDASVYQKLISLSESGIYIMFDKDLITSNTTTSATTTTNGNNFLKLMSLLVANSGTAKYNNILPVSDTYFSSLVAAGEDGLSTAKEIADIINGGNYRNSNKGNSAARKYRVLEIEPCYPVDLVLANKTKKSDGTDRIKTTKYENSGKTDNMGGYGYYSIPDQVLYGVTKDEIDEDEEYYAFNMTKAKVAHATGIDYNSIDVEQMSTNQFISSKKVPVEDYDMIYIGGNTSALVPYFATNFRGGDGFTFLDDGAWNKNVDKSKGEEYKLSQFTVFDMYTHTGAFADYSSIRAFNTIGGTTSNNVTQFNGNDISSYKLGELKQFVDSGLPIIIDKKVTDTFKPVYDNEDNRLAQLSLHHIDPDSNMYQFLCYAYDNKNNTNVSWGEVAAETDNTDSTVAPTESDPGGYINQDKIYGNTTSSFVTVLTGGSDTSLKKVYDDTKKETTRPLISLTDYPIEYIEGNASTVNKTSTVSFSAKVDGKSGETYKVRLYVDEDMDGLYSTGEMKAEKDCLSGGSVDLSFSLSDDFFGLINWKVTATVDNNDTKTTGSTTSSAGATSEKYAESNLRDAVSGCSFFQVKNAKDEPKKIRVLQVMPTGNIDKDGYTGSLYCLYFCTECQEGSHRLHQNITFDDDSPKYMGVKNSTEREYVWNGKTTKVKVGLHEHTFGIVKYISETGYDDWETNFAYELTHGSDGYPASGQYAFDVDIVSAEEFDTLATKAAARSEADVKKAAKDFETADSDYTNDMEKWDVDLRNPNFTNYYTATDKDNYTYLGKDADGNDKDLSLTKYEKLELDLQLALYHFANLDSCKNEKFGAVIAKGIGTQDSPGQWVRDREYYKIWNYLNESTGSAAIGSGHIPDAEYEKLAKAYNAYIEEYDQTVKKKNDRIIAARNNGDAKTWMNNSYDIVVLGFADLFGKKDLTEEACNQLVTYANSGGTILDTHDSLSLNTNATSINMPKKLRELFGMDRFHVAKSNPSKDFVLTAKIPSTRDVTLSIPTAGEKKLSLSIPKPKQMKAYVGYTQWATVSDTFDLLDSDYTIKYHSNGVGDPWDNGKKSFSELSSTKSSSTNTFTITVDANDYTALPYVEVWGYDGSGQNGWYAGHDAYSKLGTIDLSSHTGTYTVTLPEDPNNSFNFDDVTITNKDVDIDITGGGTTPAVTYKTEHASLSDTITVNVKVAAGTSLTINDGTATNVYKDDDNDGIITFTTSQGMTNKDYTLTVADKDLEVDTSSGSVQTTEVGEAHTALGDLLSVKVKAEAGIPVTIDDGDSPVTVAADDTGYATLSVAQGAKDITQSLSFDDNDVNVTWNTDTNTVTTAAGSAITGGQCAVSVSLTKGGAKFPDGGTVKCTFHGVTSTQSVSDGSVAFSLDSEAADPDISSLLNPSTRGGVYVRYGTRIPSDVKKKNPYTKDNTATATPYFFTERFQAKDKSEYATVTNGWSKYNAPLGLTDLYCSVNSQSIGAANSPYRFAWSLYSMFEQGDLNTDGENYQAKYGTRKASQVNKGGVTMYPFAISSDLIVSPTHGQAFALDMDDPNVAVWYSLGGNFKDANDTDISMGDFSCGSSIYAATPRDGENFYFLYSRVCDKGNIFYTGAGHNRVTGKGRNNNDERKLFINVIVSSILRINPESSLELRLYNRCDETGNKHANCDEYEVVRKADGDNQSLSNEPRTLFYNKADEMYQYYIDENSEKLYPEFDFKALTNGGPSLTEVQVFYDLNYYTGTGTVTKDTYEKDEDVMVYEKTSLEAQDIDGLRMRLRESVPTYVETDEDGNEVKDEDGNVVKKEVSWKSQCILGDTDISKDKLIIKDEYFKPYGDEYTYLVIRVDDGTNIKSARIRISKIPHLFDLTDADYECQGFDYGFLTDFISKKKFNY